MLEHILSYLKAKIEWKSDIKTGWTTGGGGGWGGSAIREALYLYYFFGAATTTVAAVSSCGLGDGKNGC